MALSGSRLQTALAADILSALQSAFPIPSALLSAEKTTCAANQTALAAAMGQGVGPDVVTEITGHAVLVVTGVVAGGGTGAGTVT